MLRYLSLFVLLAPLSVAAPVPPEDAAARMRRIYGTADDRNKGARYELDGDKLRIFVPPPSMVDRRFDPRPVSTPRIWQDVTGDFTAVVQIAGHRGCGGLVAWADLENHLAVSRGCANDRSQFQLVYCYTNSVRTAAPVAAPKPEAPAYLRLTRKGKRLTAGYSPDGKEWVDFIPDDVEWGETIKVGLFAKNWVDATAILLTFDQYRLTVAKK
jgi:hypothetical protein